VLLLGGMPPFPLAGLRDAADSYPPPSRSRAFLELSPVLVRDTLWSTALDTGAGSAAPEDLATAWDDLVWSRLRVHCESTGRERCYVIAQLSDAPADSVPCLDPSEAALLARLLCGDLQKVLACEHGMAASTVSVHLFRALVKLGLSGTSVPLPIVLTAQAWVLGTRIADARSSSFEHQGRVYRMLSVPRPQTSRISCLTPAEQEIAELLIEGLSRSEIALSRGASVNTVARQISAVFSALKVTGRHALVRVAVDLGCFD